LISLRPLRPLAARAAALARKLDHPVYDCLYLALAEAEGAPLVTADRRFLPLARRTAGIARVSSLRSLA
jgi:predicted nucleic acid-binding protein